jgi:hypothetical protein
MKRYIPIVLLSCAGTIYAQQSSPSQPLDLQEFVITGKASADIRGGIKQLPEKPALLRSTELDSINTLEKIPAPLLGSVPLPRSPRSSRIVNGYVQGEFGQFYTPQLLGNYSFETGGYAMNADARIETSGGHRDRAEYTIFGAGLNASYVAPDKFVFFGGSRTETGLRFGSQNYKFFGADSAAASRSVQDLNAMVNIHGNYEGFQYSAGAGWSSMGISTAGNSVTDSRLLGFADVVNRWKDYNVGAHILLDFHSFRSNSSYHFMEFGGMAEYMIDKITLKAGINLQSALNSWDASLAGINLRADAQYRISEQFTAMASFNTGLNNASFQEFIRVNPYITDSSAVSFQRDILMLRPVLWYHPTADFSVSAGAMLRMSSDIPVFIPHSAADGSFTTAYVKGSILELNSEMLWKPRADMSLTGQLSLNTTSLSDSSSSLPMIPDLRAAIRLERQWDEHFGTQITSEYIGKRTVDLGGTRSLDPYLLLGARLSYRFENNITAFLRLDNLLASKVFLWQGYQERGVFIAAGARYTF